MSEIFMCVIIVLALLYFVGPYVKINNECPGNAFAFATDGMAQEPNADSVSGYNYNDYLQTVGLDPSIKQQHEQWTNDLMLNYQPRMNSIRDDCDDGETPRWGLLKKDYGNVINENQNISIPSGRTCTQGDGGNSRFGGYGIGLCPVERTM